MEFLDLKHQCILDAGFGEHYFSFVLCTSNWPLVNIFLSALGFIPFITDSIMGAYHMLHWILILNFGMSL